MKKFILGLMLLAAGCGSEATNAPEATAKLPADLIATTQPADAKDLAAVKASAKAGDAIVIRGRVGGTESPLAENRAIMTIIDPSVPTCDKTPMDTCKTPWDSCCEPADVRTAKSATVQVVGSDGKPIKASLKGVGGIAPSKQVVVAGTAKPAGDALVVEARQIYVLP
jgi:hypothetical protein